VCQSRVWKEKFTAARKMSLENLEWDCHQELRKRFKRRETASMMK
jgi:hypothetical protein